MTVFRPLRPAGFIHDCMHFAAGFIGILLHTDAGSKGGKIQKKKRKKKTQNADCQLPSLAR